ncbi:ParB/RepB/Spo0J family partition protein [Novosphingobium sp. BL-8A]|uniref:ParB/RepB/Spo0J family partition protein n=1 Tax=Novosphingobium sp. BL-8A TaxID=3127639 RepID=UPI0037577732
MTMVTVPLNQLVVSPLNVRTNVEDAEDVKAIAQSIPSMGLIEPPIVHPMPADSGASFGVLAGGRRLRALQYLASQGELASDYPVEVIVRDVDPAKITEISLAENLLRRPLRAYEIHAGIARAHDEGSSIEQIAKGLGQRPIWVAQQIRLGQLIAEIFEAHINGEISPEEAKAYAATADKELQRAAWTRFSGLQPYERTAAKIRAFLKIGDAENERLLRFVDPEVYARAGGRIELDLFEEGPEQGRVLDEGILRELAESKLAFLRDDLRARTGRDLRFVAQPPLAHGFPDQALEVCPVSAKEGIALKLPEGDIVVTLLVDTDGKAESRFWWASRKAKREAERGAVAGGAIAKATTSIDMTVRAGDALGVSSGDSDAQAARAAVKEEHGLTAHGLQAMRSIRREILRALLVDNADEGGSAGRDYLVWSQLRSELVKGTLDRHVGARGLSSEWRGADDTEPTDYVAPLLEETWAHAVWTQAVQRLQAEPFMTIEDLGEAFLAFYRARDDIKRRAGAVLAGLAMLRSANTPGWRVDAHDALASVCPISDVDARTYWSPTPRFVSLFPRLKRLEFAQGQVDAESFRSWNKLTDPVLISATSAVLTEDKGWVHSLLSFGVANGPANGATRQYENREVVE